MPRIGEVGKTLRNVKRYQEILAALFRYGFEDVISETKLDQWIGFRKGQTKDSEPQEGHEKLPRAVRLRRVLEGLGPTFIKMGQVLSTRPDLIPPHWAEEFKKLQDSCPSLEFNHIRKTLEQQFPGELDKIFKSIEDKPLGAASVAQVHRAVLIGGEKVVIKVLRPNVRRIIATDMEVLSRIAEFVEWHFTELGYSATDVVEEFSVELKRECDFTQEGRSTDRLREYFEDDSRISFPKVYWHATTRDVLTLEEVQGKALSKIDLKQFSQEQRRSIVSTGADAVLRQCLHYGFFHADPHPGNIFILPGECLCFVDCGMTGHIDRRTSEQLADLLLGITTGDLDRIIGVIVALTNADPALGKDRRFREALWKFVLHFENCSLDRLDIPEILNEFFSLLRDHNIRCPADLVFLIKAISTIERVGEEIDPTFDIVGHIRPYVEELVAKRYGFGAIRGRFQRSVLKYVELAEGLPEEVQGLISQLRGNRFNVNLEHKNLDRLTYSIEHSSRNIAYSMIIAGLLVGSSLLVLAGRMAADRGLFALLGLVGLGGGLALIVILLIANYRYRQK